MFLRIRPAVCLALPAVVYWKKTIFQGDFTLSQSFTISAISQADIPALHQLIRKARPDEPQNSPETIVQEMAYGIRYYGAWLDGVLAGYAAAFVHTDPPDLLATDLYTEEAQRGPGVVAQALVDRVVAELGGGLHRLALLSCRPQDMEAIGAWVWLGFSQGGEVVGEVIPDEGEAYTTESCVLLRPLTGVREALDIQGVIFDMDGLLFDTEALYLMAWPEAGAMMGLDIPLSVARKSISVSNEESERIFQAHCGPAFTLEKALPLMDAWVRDYVLQNGLPVKPGARELLRLLREKGIPTALGSSNLRYAVDAYLEAAELAEFFDVLVAGDMVAKRKPAPDIFLRAAKEMGISPARCLVLEDSPVGVLAAYRAGCVPAMVPDQLGPEDETYGLMWRMFSSLEQLPLALF